MAARKKSCKCKKGSGMKIDIAKQLAKCGLDIYKIVKAKKGGIIGPRDRYGLPIPYWKRQNPLMPYLM